MVDQVEPCAPQDIADPASYYCPAGSTRRYRTEDFRADTPGQRGTYTVNNSPLNHRTTAQACPAGHACWAGMKYPLVAFADGQCGGGSMVLPLSLEVGPKPWLKHAKVRRSGVLFNAALRTFGAVGRPSSSAIISLRDFKTLPGCTAANPFLMASTGALAGEMASLSLLDCPLMGFTIRATIGSATASCTVVVRAATASAASRAAAIATGDGHMCYLARAGTDWGGAIHCVGKYGDASPRIAALPVVDGHGFLQVAVGATHSCGLDATGAIRCVGAALGRGGGLEHLWHEPSHQDVKYVSVAAGNDFTCGITRGYISDDDTLRQYRYLECRGSNVRLAQAYTAMQEVWKSNPVATVAVGSSVACAILDSDSSLRCFGTGAASFLQSVPSGAFTSVAVGDDADACAICSATGFMVCWGTLWNGGSLEYPTAYDSVALGSDWMCAIKGNDKALACFGMHVPRVFVNYDSLPKAAMAQISARGSTLCVLQENGRAECFGELARSSPGTIGALPSGDAAMLSTISHRGHAKSR